MVATVSLIIMFFQQFTISKQDSSRLDTPGETKTDGIASNVPKTADTKTDETGAESSTCSTDQSKTASLVTSRDVRSRKRISFKLGQKQWAGLKKRRKSFAVRKKEEARKMLTLQKSTDGTAGYSKGISMLFIRQPKEKGQKTCLNLIRFDT